ncbi:MAG: hypothetical protein GY714_31885 [Desulfobacterales bacterium]|nr:hypothetical protein [Desulfobacterales bacterium]
MLEEFYLNNNLGDAMKVKSVILFLFFILAVSIFPFNHAFSEEIVEAKYLKPGNISTVYKYIRLGERKLKLPNNLK